MLGKRGVRTQEHVCIQVRVLRQLRQSVSVATHNQLYYPEVGRLPAICVSPTSRERIMASAWPRWHAVGRFRCHRLPKCPTTGCRKHVVAGHALIDS